MGGRNDIDPRRSGLRIASMSILPPASLLQETSLNAKGEQLPMCRLWR